METFQIPVARWMFKKRSDSLGIFLGARESMQGFSPEHIQEVCTGNCRHTGPPDGLSKFLLVSLNLQLISLGVKFLVF